MRKADTLKNRKLKGANRKGGQIFDGARLGINGLLWGKGTEQFLEARVATQRVPYGMEFE
jgi:hypothetical protein